MIPVTEVFLDSGYTMSLWVDGKDPFIAIGEDFYTRISWKDVQKIIDALTDLQNKRKDK